jgi:archaellum component FlaC
MGAQVRDPQDPDINDDMDEFDDIDDPSPSVDSKGKGTQKATKKLRSRISTESDDWQDPQDDIMYGFRD